jgi:Short C-terminal domain
VAAPSAAPAASDPKQPAPASAPASLGRGRRILVWTLVVLGTVLALVAILTTWVNRQMLDNSAWNKATSQVIQDPQVQTALATYTVNQLYANVNVAQALENRLPSQLDPLAPTLAGALQQPAIQGVKLALERPRIQQLFIRVSGIAHQKLVNVLENKTGYGISTGNGDVTLNLHELVVEVGTNLGLSADTLAKLPGTAGTITLMKSDQLATAQTGVQTLRVLSAWLLVGVLFLYGLAIWLAHGARRATLRNAGIGLALVGIITLILRKLLGNYVTSSLAKPGYEPATHRLWLIGTSILGQIGEAVLLYGAIAALGAVFAGPTAPAVWLRQRLAPVLNERQGVVWGGVGFVYLLAILWGGTHALRTWWGILLLAGLIAMGVVALRRQTLQEFPSGTGAEAETPPASEEPPDEAVTAHGAPARSPASELTRLAALHASGALSDDEFEQAKRIALT